MERNLNGYFCDDIRLELGGKFSLVGCYGPIMTVPSFPVTLSKLCASVRVVTGAGRPFTDLKVVVMQDDKVLGEAVVPPEALAEAADSVVDLISLKPSVSRKLTFNINFTFSPLEIVEKCTLRVRAYTGDETIRGLALRVSDEKSNDIVVREISNNSL